MMVMMKAWYVVVIDLCRDLKRVVIGMQVSFLYRHILDLVPRHVLKDVHPGLHPDPGAVQQQAEAKA